MAEKLTERFEMRLSEQGVERLDEWRRQQPDIPSRAEAIRRLVDRGLHEQEAFTHIDRLLGWAADIAQRKSIPKRDVEALTNILLDMIRGERAFSAREAEVRAAVKALGDTAPDEAPPGISAESLQRKVKLSPDLPDDGPFVRRVSDEKPTRSYPAKPPRKLGPKK